MELKTLKNCHGLYNLQYHLILVTKYRNPCINDEIFSLLYNKMAEMLKTAKGELIEMNYEADHIHILMSVPPQIQLSKFINSYKTTSARLIRSKFAAYLQKFYWKDVFWSRSYLILSSGGAPIEIIKKYIQEQRKNAPITT